MDHSDTPDNPASLSEALVRLAAMEQRLASLEAWRNMGAPRQPRAIPPQVRPPISMDPSLAATPPIVTQPQQPPNVDAAVSTPLGTPRREPAPAAAPRAMPKPKSAVNIEQMVAGRWYAYAGAVVLVMGVALGLKWAYDVGLLRVSPAWRCILATAFGCVLIGAGREAGKRVNAWAAAACYAAGLGAIYASVYAAFELYSLFNPAMAMVLLGATSVLGVAVSVRSRLASVGILSIVAGFVAPLLLWKHSGPPWALPSYLIALSAMATVVGVLRGGAFRVMRDVALAGTMLIGAGWMSTLSAGGSIAATVFLAITWAIAQAEMLRIAIMGPLSVGVPGGNGQNLDRAWRGQTLVSSFGVSMWAAGFGYHVAQAAGWSGDWLLSAACCVSSAVLAYTLAPVDWKAPREGQRSLDLSAEHWKQVTGWNFWLQAGVLLGITILILLGGLAEAAAWTGLGIGAVLLAQRLRSQPLAFYAAAAFVMLIARAALSPSWHTGVLDLPVELLTVKFTWWSVSLIVGACGACGAIWVRDAIAARRRFFAGVACLGVLVVFVATARDSSHGLGVMFTWLGLAMGLIALARRPRWQALGHAAFVGLLLSTGAWVGQFIFDGWSNRGWPLALHPGLLSAVALALGFGPMWRWHRTPEAESQVASLMAKHGGWASGLILLLSTSLYLAHVAGVFQVRSDARSALISMWWGVFGFVTVTLGFRWKAPRARYAGLGLLALGAAKAVLLDLADVSTLWRVVSFLALGALLMTVGIGYQWFEKRLTRQVPSQAEPTPPR